MWSDFDGRCGRFLFSSRQDVGFDKTFRLVVQLPARGGKYLKAVVLIAIVGRTDHHPRIRRECARKEGDAGDGLITTLCLLRAVRDEGKLLHDLTEGFQRYPQVLMNVEVREKRPFVEVDQIQKLVQETESQLGDGGRLLLRYSGTEPLARVMIEGYNQAMIEVYARNLAIVIQQTLGAK